MEAVKEALHRMFRETRKVFGTLTRRNIFLGLAFMCQIGVHAELA